MHFFATLFLVSLVLNFIFVGAAVKILALALLLFTLHFGYQYVKWNFGMEPKNKFWTWCKMKYLTNLSFIRGGLKDFKKHQVLCIEPSF
jgi:hypothetical protein